MNCKNIKKVTASFFLSHTFLNGNNVDFVQKVCLIKFFNELQIIYYLSFLVLRKFFILQLTGF